MGNSVIFPLFDADGIRLTSLRLGPPSAVTYANWLQQKGRSNVAFQAPRGDAEFDAAVNDFVTYVTANLANLGLVAGDLTDVNANKTIWDAEYPAHIAQQSAAEAQTNTKNVARQGMLDSINALLVTIEGKHQVDDAERTAMHATVRDTVLTPSPVPTTRPVARVDSGQRWQHLIHFSDETTPMSVRKPDGVRAAQIFVKVGGPAPTGPDDCEFLATDTRSPYLAVFDQSFGNQPAHYLLRWENTRGELGPWSETVSATIGA